MAAPCILDLRVFQIKIVMSTRQNKQITHKHEEITFFLSLECPLNLSRFLAKSADLGMTVVDFATKHSDPYSKS